MLCFQHYSSRYSQGFKDEDLGDSPGWWAAIVALYCPSTPLQLTQKKITKQGERMYMRCTCYCILLKHFILTGDRVFQCHSCKGGSSTSALSMAKLKLQASLGPGPRFERQLKVLNGILGEEKSKVNQNERNLTCAVPACGRSKGNFHR